MRRIAEMMRGALSPRGIRQAVDQLGPGPKNDALRVALTGLDPATEPKVLREVLEQLEGEGPAYDELREALTKHLLYLALMFVEDYQHGAGGGGMAALRGGYVLAKAKVRTLGQAPAPRTSPAPANLLGWTSPTRARSSPNRNPPPRRWTMKIPRHEPPVGRAAYHQTVDYGYLWVDPEHPTPDSGSFSSLVSAARRLSEAHS